MSILPEEDRNQVWKDIPDALYYVHSHGILHHDVKPQNIIFGRQRGAVLCDFGCSSTVSTQVTPSDAGTPGYIPPEYLINKRGLPGDVWALGLTMAFVERLMVLPRDNWMIADVHSDEETKMKMIQSLRRIREIKIRIPKHLRLLKDILYNNPDKRITALQLVSRLNNRYTT